MLESRVLTNEKYENGKWFIDFHNENGGRYSIWSFDDLNNMNIDELEEQEGYYIDLREFIDEIYVNNYISVEYFDELMENYDSQDEELQDFIKDRKRHDFEEEL